MNGGVDAFAAGGHEVEIVCTPSGLYHSPCLALFSQP